jgi:alpha-beta hydrolase superfamily lysophospholipase
MRGHGKSEGKKGYLESQNIILDDLKKFINLTDKIYNDITQNKFILGYSLGGLYANVLSLELSNYFNGMIMISPPMYMETKKHELLLKIAYVLRNFIPSLPLIKLKCKIKVI